jgi:AcrR family transcriptional regulator
MPQDTERTRQILAAATACIASRGFHLTSIDDIARAAGISPALIYRHFAGKQSIIVALVTEHMEQMHEASTKAVAEPDTQKALNLFFGLSPAPLDTPDQLIRNGVLHLEIMAEATRNPEVAGLLRSLDQHRHNCLVGILLKGGAPAGAAASSQAAASAELLLALADGLEARAALATPAELAADPWFDRALQDLFKQFIVTT